MRFCLPACLSVCIHLPASQSDTIWLLSDANKMPVPACARMLAQAQASAYDKDLYISFRNISLLQSVYMPSHFEAVTSMILYSYLKFILFKTTNSAPTEAF